jgi:hypothetical protein
MSRKREITFGVALIAIAINFMSMAGVQIDLDFLKVASVAIGLAGCYIVVSAIWPSLR